MNLRIELPAILEQSLMQRAAEAGVDVETFVVDSIRERLGQADPATTTSMNFEDWLSDVRKLVPVVDHLIDDSRESIYAGRGE